jgi:hypothetical protein
MWSAPPEDIARITQFERHVEPRLRARYPNQPDGAGTGRFIAFVKSALSRRASQRPRVTVPAAPAFKVDQGRAV